MGVGYNPKIITDGLVLCLDPANTKSYPGSGTAWTDLSGQGRNATLTNGVGFSINNGGVFTFDGVNDFAATSNFQTFGTDMTWEAWVYCTHNISGYNMFMGRYTTPYFSFYIGNTLLFSNVIAGTQVTISSSSTLSLNTWYHATFTTSFNGSSTTMKIYTNGVETATGTYTGSQTNYAYNFTIGDVNDGATAWYPFKGNIGAVKVYNKTLTISEIQQNFNATRGRYGI